MGKSYAEGVVDGRRKAALDADVEVARLMAFIPLGQWPSSYLETALNDHTCRLGTPKSTCRPLHDEWQRRFIERKLEAFGEGV